MTKSYDKLSWVLRLVLQLIFGVLISGIYRIVRFVEKKNVTTLVVGLLGLFTGIGNVILWIVDLVTLIVNKKYTVFVD